MNKKFDIDLQDKVVVITGAGGFICGGIAKELATSGAKLALLDHTPKNAEICANEVRKLGGRAYVYE